ncbi:Ger(x)C family spore germination protein [Sporosarcina beigongshangi]|uniref:Ger(x)C family spore germination protein n=1 Tax=Sporosarcina beigongshangi TaxID=2782538 RepID=UPI00193AE00C|nr:Ger(x)C family spore germination protein [Sporosarcina beigongshangi]
MKKIILLLCVLSTLYTVGCTREGQRSSVEDLALVSSVGLDYVNEKEIRMTVSIPQPRGESPVLTEVYSVNTEMIQEGLVNISSEADKMIILNQLRTILFNEEFAKSGKVTKVIEHFYRDSTIGNKVRLVIVKDKAEEVLRADYPENEHMDAYLNDLFQPKLHNSFSPFTSINDYISDQESPIYHTMIPYLEKKEKSLKIIGIALFNDEKMIQTISNQESLLIQALKGLEKLSPIAIKFKETEQDQQLLVEQIENVLKVKSNKNIDSPKLDISLKLEGVIVEYKGKRDLSKNEENKKLEKEINKHIAKEIEDLLKKLQESEVDPVGFSEYFRMYHKGKWTDDLTMKVIRSAEYKVNVKFKILNTGTLK